MYPFVRMAKEKVKFRNAPRLAIFETHVSHHRCWPWDLDFFFELNNGRTLTFFDLGRVVLAARVGLIDLMKQQRWGLTVAGSSVRYRQRVRMFDTLEMRSRCIGWDDRFIYIEQSMWRGDQCTSHALLRTALTDANGIVTTDRVLAAMGVNIGSAPLPAWVETWVASEKERTWPPMQEEIQLAQASSP